MAIQSFRGNPELEEKIMEWFTTNPAFTPYEALRCKLRVAEQLQRKTHGLTPLCCFVLPADESCQYFSTPSDIVCSIWHNPKDTAP